MKRLEVLIVRHGVAAEREAFAATGQNDDLRPLTDEGRRKMCQVARGLRVLLPRLGTIAASPLVRARETAEIIADQYGLTPVRLEALAPGNGPEALLPFIESERGSGPVVLVGHEPDLGHLAAWMVAGGGEFMPLRKGGACLVTFERAAGAGRGTLDWLLPPKVLRRLGA